MDQNLNQELLDKLTKVCLCKGISRLKVKEAILNGANTLEKVQRATGAGNGSCNGKRCSIKIMELLSNIDSSK